MSEINNNPYNHINFKLNSIKEDEKCLPKSDSGCQEGCEETEDISKTVQKYLDTKQPSSYVL